MKSFSAASLGELTWRVPRRCQGGNCVRITANTRMIMVGDSEQPCGPVFIFNATEWAKLVDRIKCGELDKVS